MADITLQNNQSLTLRLKACGLSSADIKKVLAALSPELENKANTDLENVDVEAFKAKADAAGIGGGSVAAYKEIEYEDIDSITESGIYKVMQGEATAKQGDGMWLIVSRTSDPLEDPPVFFVNQFYFSISGTAIKARTRNPFDGGWFDWSDIGAGGSVDLSNYYTKKEIDSKFGDVDTALDSIIELQNSYVGGGSV